jgi:hypothetical protein
MSENIQTLTELYECMRRPLDSVNLRRFFLMLFRAHWSDAANHGQLKDFFDCLQYDDNKDERTVDVELAHVYDVDKGTTRPSIYVGFSGFSMKKIAIGNAVGRSEDNSVRREGKKAETLLRVGHIAQSADMALLMAESNAVLLQGIEKDICSNMDLLSLEVLDWSDARLLEKSPDRNFQVDLQCAISFNFMVEIDMESHRIKKFGTTFTT